MTDTTQRAGNEPWVGGSQTRNRRRCACGMPVTFDPEEVVLPVIRPLTEGASDCYSGPPPPPPPLPLEAETTVRKTTSKGRDQVQSWNWFLYGKTENIIKIKIKPVLKKASPWSFHLLPLALQRDEAPTPGQRKDEGLLPLLFPHPIPILISTVGAPGGTKPG